MRDFDSNCSPCERIIIVMTLLARNRLYRKRPLRLMAVICAYGGAFCNRCTVSIIEGTKFIESTCTCTSLCPKEPMKEHLPLKNLFVCFTVTYKREGIYVDFTYIEFIKVLNTNFYFNVPIELYRKISLSI